MGNKYILPKNIIAGAAIIVSLFLTSCTKDSSVEPVSDNAKVAGRISSSGGMAKTASAASTQEGVQGATVILAQVQADGSLKTVSTQNIQTDASGKFVVETGLSGANNLIVVATKGTTQWKAIVSSKVQTGTTVYAPPLTTESTEETNVYLKLVGQGHLGDFDEGDLKLLLNSQVAAYIMGNPQAETDFMNAFQTSAQTIIQASGNSYFGLTGTQMIAMMQAKADAETSLDKDLYNSSDTEADNENCRNNYEKSVITAYAGTSANIYAELMRIGVTAFVNSSASMNTDFRLAIAKSFYARYAFVLNYAMQQQFQAAGASDSQVSSVSSAGSALYASINSSMDLDQIASAFVQYRSSIKAQLQVTLQAYASLIDTIDTTINGAVSAKSTFNATITGTTSADAIINAYVSLFTAIKTTSQTTLAGASSAQINAASQILIMANMN